MHQLEAKPDVRLQLVAGYKYALDTLRELERPESQHKSTNFDIWMEAHSNYVTGAHSEGLDSHYVPRHLVEHPSELQKWHGPKWWAIGNKVVDQCAKWGAELAAVSPEEVAAQQVRD